MKKIKWKFPRRRKHQERDPLVENKDPHAGLDCADDGLNSPFFQNLFNNNVERCAHGVDAITVQQIAEFLHVTSDADFPEDGSFDSQDHRLTVVCLIERSASQCLPEPPAGLDQHLQQHLEDVQETVHNALMRLAPLLGCVGMTGELVDCYHQQMIHHLNGLLQEVQSSQRSLVLMDWVLHKYLSPEFLDQPQLQEMVSIKKVDSQPLTEWMEKAKDKLLEHVKREVRGNLEKILQIESETGVCDCEESYVWFYVDIIQCIESVPGETQKRISPELSERVREVCFEELLMCLRSYSNEQTETLGNLTKTQEPDMIQLFKTLTTCKELKQHIQSKSEGIKKTLIQELVATLEKTENFTLKLVKVIVTDAVEKHLKTYFKSENKQFMPVIQGIQDLFSKPLWPQDDRKMVMDEVYKLITHVYLKSLVRSFRSKLTNRLRPDLQQLISRDAELLHNAISDLAPGVEQWNLELLRIAELLECEDIEAVKLTAASMQMESPMCSEDLGLLPGLLWCKGLSRWQVREVLDALPQQQPRSTGPWYSRLICCCSHLDVF